MSVLVTRHHGYIGSVVAPMLMEAGHDVTGLDTFFYEGCDLLDDAVDVPTLRMDLRDVTTDVLEGYEGIIHFAALSNDPLGNSMRNDAGHQSAEPSSLRGLRRSRCPEVRLRLVLQHVRSVRHRRANHRGGPASALDGLRGVEGPRGGGAVRARRRRLRPVIFMRNATAYGASPRIRLDVVLNNLAAWAFTTGRC